ncbi:MAG: pyrroline-5-carboxylate reductase, partial [Lentisphaerae bacterium]|nr:pyrroline-5-carboxylate reductase [Lentisphaerota bacterium]
AFFAYLLDCVIKAGIAEGLDKDNAHLMAEQTMLGTASLLMHENMNPAQLIKVVSSAKGTTSAGLEVLEGSAIDRILADTIRAAARRSKELSKST